MSSKSKQKDKKSNSSRSKRNKDVRSASHSSIMSQSIQKEKLDWQKEILKDLESNSSEKSLSAVEKS